MSDEDFPVSSSVLTTPRSLVSRAITSIVYALGRTIVLPSYFGDIKILGLEHFPRQGPVVIAPIHRSRWDGLMIGYVFGRPVTQRDPNFMVTANEMQGLQGWLIRQCGGFPINPDQPSVASLRLGVDLLKAEQVLVIFPEGDVKRDRYAQFLKPGFARLALRAQQQLKSGSNIQVLPVALDYGCPIPHWRCGLTITIGRPLNVSEYKGPVKPASLLLINDLKKALNNLMDCPRPSTTLPTVSQFSPLKVIFGRQAAHHRR
ncbi:MAG: 1-acyl-sn-glycerol-3-phosphate acyltransferase [Acaryochloridaceae cyanobacterium SU_2_1]|nr:1-acyl-sn-glycerol-3-phosphate acyltransferase [Acaryochloridaceae cyanobacterium SU_2_1]